MANLIKMYVISTIYGQLLISRLAQSLPTLPFLFHPLLFFLPNIMNRLFRDDLLVAIDAPCLFAFAATDVHGDTQWLMWCSHCKCWHAHGPGDGYRKAHCNDPKSPYFYSGYNLVFGGNWVERN